MGDDKCGAYDGRVGDDIRLSLVRMHGGGNICSNRTRFRSNKNTAVHRIPKYGIQVPVFLHGPFWKQLFPPPCVRTRDSRISETVAIRISVRKV